MDETRNYTIVDFFDDMPNELRVAVFKTDVCRRFLLERRRIGEIASSKPETGNIGNNAMLINEISKLEELQNELKKVIADCKYEIFCREEFGTDKEKTD